MNYEKKYKDALTAVKKLQETNPSDEGIQNWINDNFPELNESEDERIMKEIAEFIYISVFKPKDIKKKEKWLTWLEKQVEEIKKIANGWNKENVINCIGMILTDASEQRFKDYGLSVKVCLDWLKKQGEPKTELATEDEIYWLEWVIGRLPDTEKANEAESVLKELLEKLKAKKGGEE